MPRRKKSIKPRVSVVPKLKRVNTSNFIPLHVKGLPPTDWDVLGEGLAATANYEKGFSKARTIGNMNMARSSTAAYIVINPQGDGFAKPMSTEEVRLKYYPGPGHTNSTLDKMLSKNMSIKANQSVTVGDPQSHSTTLSDGSTFAFKPKMFRMIRSVSNSAKPVTPKRRLK